MLAFDSLARAGGTVRRAMEQGGPAVGAVESLAFVVGARQFPAVPPCEQTHYPQKLRPTWAETRLGALTAEGCMLSLDGTSCSVGGGLGARRR
jgi:hypothetical protein